MRDHHREDLSGTLSFVNDIAHSGVEDVFLRIAVRKKGKDQNYYSKAGPDFTPMAFKVLVIGQKRVKAA